MMVPTRDRKVLLEEHSEKIKAIIKERNPELFPAEEVKAASLAAAANVASVVAAVESIEPATVGEIAENPIDSEQSELKE